MESPLTPHNCRTPLPSPGPRGPRSSPATPSAACPQPLATPSDIEPVDLPLHFFDILRELSSVHITVCEQRRLAEAKLEKANKELEAMRLKPKVTLNHTASSQQSLEETYVSDIKDTFVSQVCPHNWPDDTPRILTHDNPVSRSSISSNHERMSVIKSSMADYEKLSGVRSSIESEKFLAMTSTLTTVAGGIAEQFALMKGWKSLDFVPPARPVLMIRILESWVFDAFATVTIIANAIVVGLAVDHAAKHGLQLWDRPERFKIAERVFTAVFACELILRLFGGFRYFCFGEKKLWNFFDLAVVLCDILQSIVDSMDSGESIDFSVLRMMRIARVVRAIRVIRLLRFFKELRMMIYSILKCGTSLLWSLLLFLIIFYVFGIFLMTQVADFIATKGSDNSRVKELKEFFGDIPRAILILYQSMSGGISWREVSGVLAAVHWSSAVALVFFTFFAVFVVSNIVTGIFVETAIQSAQSDREEAIQAQLATQASEFGTFKQIFVEADKDRSGHITLEELQVHLGDTKMRARLSVLGIHVNEALGLFKLLDQDHSGHISIEEFVMGCFRLKGGAKGIDLATLMYETKKLVSRIASLDKMCVEQFMQLKRSQDNLSQQLRSHGAVS